MCDNFFSLRVKELRSSENLTQSQLGKLVGLSKQTINDMEHGRSTTTAVKLLAIANYFDVSVDYLLGRTETKNRSKISHCLSEEQQQLLNVYNLLNQKNKGAILERANMLLELQQEENSNTDKSITPQMGA